MYMSGAEISGPIRIQDLSKISRLKLVVFFAAALFNDYSAAAPAEPTTTRTTAHRWF